MANDWIVSGVTEALSDDEKSIRFWIDSLSGEHWALVTDDIPDWVREVGAQFRTTIPRRCVQDNSLDNVMWGEFTLQPYADLGMYELWELLEKAIEALHGNPSVDDSPFL